MMFNLKTFVSILLFKVEDNNNSTINKFFNSSLYFNKFFNIYIEFFRTNKTLDLNEKIIFGLNKHILILEQYDIHLKKIQKKNEKENKNNNNNNNKVVVVKDNTEKISKHSKKIIKKTNSSKKSSNIKINVSFSSFTMRKRKINDLRLKNVDPKLKELMNNDDYMFSRSKKSKKKFDFKMISTIVDNKSSTNKNITNKNEKSTEKESNNSKFFKFSNNLNTNSYKNKDLEISNLDSKASYKMSNQDFEEVKKIEKINKINNVELDNINYLIDKYKNKDSKNDNKYEELDDNDDLWINDMDDIIL